MNQKIFLDVEYISAKNQYYQYDLSANGICAYIALRTLITVGFYPKSKIITATDEALCNCLHNDGVIITNEERKLMHQGILELIHNNLITPLDDITVIKDEIIGEIDFMWLLNAESLITNMEKGIPVKQQVTYLYFEEIFSLMDIVSIDIAGRFTLLKYFCNLMQTVNNKTGVGFCSVNKLLEKTGIENTETVILYNNILESHNLLYTKKYDSVVSLSNNSLVNFPTFYGRPNNKLTIEHIAHTNYIQKTKEIETVPYISSVKKDYSSKPYYKKNTSSDDDWW